MGKRLSALSESGMSSVLGRVCQDIVHGDGKLKGILQQRSVGLHDELNWIIAIVGLCSLSEQGSLSLYGCESLAQSMSYDRWRCTHFNYR